MKKEAMIASLVLATIIMPSILGSGMAVTIEDAKLAGYGFHEPGPDWWDPEYRYRMQMNMTAVGPRDINMTVATVDFSTVMNASDGIVDMASMQLVKVGVNQSSIPVDFQVETDVVDIWNPSTVPEIEGPLIDAILQENGTFIGTVFNAFEGEGLMNQSIRFEAIINQPVDEVMVQFVYQPEYEKGIASTDYLQLYAGVPGDWGTPVLIYRSSLPGTKAWTGYITLPLENTMNGSIYINMDAPGISGDEEKYFSIDFAFLDGNGFDRDVIHYVPEAEAISNIKQDSYYPKVQVLETTSPPECDIYTIADFNSTYYLYYNLMAESNHRVINNDAVPFFGSLSLPQTYAMFSNDIGTTRIDTDRAISEGNMTFGSNETDSWMSLLDPGIKYGDPGYSFSKYFGKIYTSVAIKNSTTSVTYTAWKDARFLDISISTTVPVNATGFINYTGASYNLTWLAYRGNAMIISSLSSGNFSSDYLTFLNINDVPGVMLVANHSLDCYLNASGVIADNATILVTIPVGTTRFGAMMFNATETPSSNATVGNDDTEAFLRAFITRVENDPVVPVSTTSETFVPLQLFIITGTPLFSIATTGDLMQVALFGHNLQSIAVNIDNKTGDVGINGNYTINVASLNRSLIERQHVFRFTGRNEFGDAISVESRLWVADGLLDMPWTAFLAMVNSVVVFLASIAAALFGIVTIASRRQGKKQCTGDSCEFNR